MFSFLFDRVSSIITRLFVFICFVVKKIFKMPYYLLTAVSLSNIVPDVFSISEQFKGGVSLDVKPLTQFLAVIIAVYL